MKTDTLFYELFQAAPQTFFELLQITPFGSYRFESLTVKTSEKRIDGVLEPTEEGQPIYFLEVQGGADAAIYWREVREVATYFEQRPKEKIRQTSTLDPNVEERLVSVMSQLIEQKFKTLSYKELNQMLQLTPLRETASVQEVLKEDHVDLLKKLIHRKFALAPELTEAITVDLQKLDLATLKALFDQILDIATFEQLEHWITSHLSE